MVDAIKPIYSSIHGGRGKNLRNNTPTFERFSMGNGDCFIPSKCGKDFRDFKSTLLLGGVLGSSCFILNVLTNAENLLKSDYAAVKNTMRATSVVAIVSLACFGILKGIEKILMKTV